MSLLLTSCTMGKQPDRLLNKGPQYLRTRTNSGLFAQNKTSAVELLAASKAQFYTIKHSVDLDRQQDLAVSEGQTERYHQSIKKKEPVRSKSEYDISQLQLARTDEENDENNNDISNDSLNTSKDVLTKVSHLLSLQDKTKDKHTSNSEEEGEALSEDALNHNQTHVSSVDITLKPSSEPQSKLTVLQSATSAGHRQIQINVESRPISLKDEVYQPTIRKPIPLPRKLKEKPVPPPRKTSTRAPFLESIKNSNQCLSPIDVSRTACSPHNPSLSSKNLLQETSKSKASPINANVDVKRTQSFGDSLTKCFLPSSTRPPLPEKPVLPPKGIKPSESNTGTESKHIYTATAIFISKPDNASQKLVDEGASIAENGREYTLKPDANNVLEASLVKDDIGNINRKKGCPDVSSSVRAVERERKNIDSYIAGPKPDSIKPALVSRFETVDKSNLFLTSTLEMSIESVDQAVYESEISAIPTASVESTIMQEADPEVREITRSNSSLSGKIEQQNTSPLSASPTPHYSVPRSYSDISCHLEGQHSRDSSIVSSHSRLSRASVGTDLENFFNQMGLEKGILEPINRLKELQTSEVFDSMSSLDSHDAASICSTYSCSDQDWSDSQSTDRSQQQTSIVERNARIIKWLCNVRKAKNQTQKSDNAAASNA